MKPSIDTLAQATTRRSLCSLMPPAWSIWGRDARDTVVSLCSVMPPLVLSLVAVIRGARHM